MSEYTRFNTNSVPQNGFRSQLENTWATWLTKLNIAFVYEPPAGAYKPDFYLPELDVFLECKGGYYSEKDLVRAEEIRLLTNMGQLLSINGPSLESPMDYIKPDGTLTKAFITTNEVTLRPELVTAEADFLPNFGTKPSEHILSLYKNASL